MILYNYRKNKTVYALAVNNTAVNGTPDKNALRFWAVTAMDWAMTSKLIAGNSVLIRSAHSR